MSRKHRHEEHEEHVDESWLLPYADLLTLMLALFIVLYSMNSVDVKKFEDMSQAFSIALSNGSGVLENTSVVKTGEDHEKKLEDIGSQGDKKEREEKKAAEARAAIEEQEHKKLDDLKKKVDAYIEKNGLTSELETKLNLSQLMITISDNALFAPAQATVKPESKALAIAISKMLQQYPEYEVIVSGHTDTTPISNASFKSNWDLSSMRAIRFMDILLENKKLNPERFSAIGYGEYRPVAENKTAQGKAKNRRVEVNIINTYIDDTNTQKLPVTK